MELEEAIKIVESMKNKLISDSSIWEDGTCSQAIDTVLKELDKKDKVIDLMAKDMVTIMKDGCSPRKDVKYEYIINGYKKFRGNGV